MRPDTKRSTHRRNSDIQSQHDLLVFGYSSRIFEAEQLAASIEDGNYLQAWRDETDVEDPVLIDRYDVRNLLDDLSAFDTPSHNTPTDAENVDDEEKELDEERYRDVDSEEEKLLDMEDDERDAYLDEKRKRKLMAAEGRLWGYDYGTEEAPGGEVTAEIVEEFDLKYPAPEGLTAPTTSRIASIIEKTARFIAKSTNPQIEFLIKAKQTNNPDFRFMDLDDPLHGYYKHVKTMVQSGLGGLADYGSDSENESNGEEQNGKDVVGAVSAPSPTTMVHQEDNSWTVAGYMHIPPAAVSTQPEHQPYKIPPDDLIPIINKTAAFVARNGPSFEAKLKEKNRGDPRFSFLLPWNELHGYYCKRKDELIANGGEEAVQNDGSGGMVGENTSKSQESAEEKAKRLAKAKAVLAKIRAGKKMKEKGVSVDGGGDASEVAKADEVETGGKHNGAEISARVQSETDVKERRLDRSKGRDEKRVRRYSSSSSVERSRSRSRDRRKVSGDRDSHRKSSTSKHKGSKRRRSRSRSKSRSQRHSDHSHSGRKKSRRHTIGPSRDQSRSMSPRRDYRHGWDNTRRSSERRDIYREKKMRRDASRSRSRDRERCYGSGRREGTSHGRR